MVKKWIIMIVLTISIIFGCYFELKYIKSTFSWLINSLETVQICATETKDEIDSDKLIEEIYNIQINWHKKVRVLKCLIWHSGIKEIEVGLARIAVYIEENEFSDAYAESASLIDYIAHYLDDFKVSIENIF